MNNTIVAGSCLNTYVSCVKNYYSKYPRNVNLLTWLHSKKYAHVVQQIRNTPDKEQRKRLKGSLPAIAPGGIFSKVEAKGLEQHSGFIQFDIDWQDNQHISNYKELHQQLRRISNIAYCGLSASGNGWWGLVRIAYPEKHEQHWAYINLAMQRLGITLDEAPKNVASLRGYSYDADAYFNHHAVKLYHYLLPPAQRRRLDVIEHNAYTARVERHLTIVEKLGKDITDTYRAWFNIGCNFAATFGDDGRDYFHRVSKYHPNYDPQHTDYQYNQCLQFVKEKNSTPNIMYFLKRVEEATGRAA